ncbi:hypothetical protein FAF44_33265 [Nonomuraea sp. MG754425]|uniref:hypothetical protein n=1 Tax=Nonomuraea sp. MG754425 TaxID=2570319 RepID=UPI001F1D3A18|nr:hypothetical protein [Nonomuraea sp. MG754425]MCF6473218.1 hypothetical protein [Nonomuraea sp. MG754425]
MPPTPGVVALPWTRRLRFCTFACSFVFAVCALLQGWLMVNEEIVELSFRLAGDEAAEASAAAPEFLTGFRVVAACQVLGNSLGMFALRGSPWSYWTALSVNLTQAGGLLGLIPAQLYRAALRAHGPAGLLPAFMICGGAVVLAVLLINSIVPFRKIWREFRASLMNG